MSVAVNISQKNILNAWKLLLCDGVCVCSNFFCALRYIVRQRAYVIYDAIIDSKRPLLMLRPLPSNDELSAVKAHCTSNCLVENVSRLATAECCTYGAVSPVVVKHLSLSQRRTVTIYDPQHRRWFWLAIDVAAYTDIGVGDTRFKRRTMQLRRICRQTQNCTVAHH